MDALILLLIRLGHFLRWLQTQVLQTVKISLSFSHERSSAEATGHFSTFKVNRLAV